MRLGAILLLLSGLAPTPSDPGRAAHAVQDQPKGTTAKAPPAVEIPFSRLVADAVVPIGLEPGAAASSDAVWVIAREGGAVVRVDPAANAAGTPVHVGDGPCASLAVAFDSVWVPLCGGKALVRVSEKDQTVGATTGATVAVPEGRIAHGVGSVWAVTDRKGVLARIDPDTNALVAEVSIPGGAAAVVFGEERLWVTGGDRNRLTRLNPHNNEVEEIVDVGPKPLRLAVGEGGIWTLNRGDGSVTRVDPATSKVVATIEVGAEVAEGEIAAGAGSVWISAPGVPIVRIDPRTNRAVQRFTGEGGGAVLVAHGSLWVAAGPKTTWRLDPELVSAVRP
jgi:YVTN family beta-propeller protein